MDTTPQSLATPSDLEPGAVRAVTEVLNPLIADAFALYLKTKNFHWHMSGARFRDLHLLLDEQAGAILAMVDPLAERVRRIGGTTLRSVGHVGRLQTIKDDDDDSVDPDGMLGRLLEDSKHFAALQRDAHMVCGGAGDVATTSLLEITIDEAEKRTWFLFETLRETDRFD